MKCPKCGSVVMLKINPLNKCLVQHECLKCGYLNSKIDYDKRDYQQRLEKVLSKFEHVLQSETNIEHYTYELEYGCINFCPFNKDFSLEYNLITFIDGISLETVDSLLNDLES